MSEVPQPALAVGHATRTLRLGLPILNSNQGRSYSSYRQSRRYANGFPARVPDASKSCARIGLTQRPQADIRLLSMYSLTTDSPWNYSIYG
ncbi:hypothetical protein [Moorena bouillonii]|uniref:hypothetical protein n=1 Tax=Moorena bouillonii TaxID=207920 RepID=UPI001300D560|nr:hypothetical protein [Moorena bouillonii]